MYDMSVIDAPHTVLEIEGSENSDAEMDTDQEEDEEGMLSFSSGYEIPGTNVWLQTRKKMAVLYENPHLCIITSVIPKARTKPRRKAKRKPTPVAKPSTQRKKIAQSVTAEDVHALALKVAKSTLSLVSGGAGQIHVDTLAEYLVSMIEYGVIKRLTVDASLMRACVCTILYNMNRDPSSPCYRIVFYPESIRAAVLERTDREKDACEHIRCYDHRRRQYIQTHGRPLNQDEYERMVQTLASQVTGSRV